MAAKIRRCSCNHRQQDEMHGQGNRVMNTTAKDGMLRCTVCSRDVVDKADKVEKKEEKK